MREKNYAYATRNVDKTRHMFKNSFCTSTIIEWNNLDPTLWNSKSFVDFKNSILKVIRPSLSNVFNCNNYKGIRLITWLRVGMCDCLNPICSYGLDIESTSDFLVHCPTSNYERYTLLSTLNNIDCKCY